MNDVHITNHAGKLLALDTSTHSLTLAVMNNRELLGASNSFAERNHSIHLMPMMEKLLSSVGLQANELEGIAVGQGPGSYTGVRIAVSVAKTMAWSLNIPIIGVSSLEALARGGIAGKSAKTRWLIPLMNARRGQAYTGLYEAAANGDHWRRLASDGIRLMDDWVLELKRRLDSDCSDAAFHRPDEILFVGEAELFQESIGQLAQSWDGGSVHSLKHDLHAYDIGILAQERWARGERDELHAMIPNYMQLAEAEAKLLAKEKRGGNMDAGSC